ncbi:MAG TPA: hypothetical protein VIE88_13760 [Vicinamibacteria bacterium]
MAFRRSSILGGIAALCLAAGAARGGQSLAEVAKKERERRVQVTKPGAESPVLSEKDLEKARGDSFSVSGQESSPPESSAQEDDAGTPAGAERGLSAKEIRDLKEQWGRIWKGQMEQAERELEQAKDDVYQCRSADRYFFVPLAIDCEGVDLRLAGAEARLKKVKRNRYHWELLLPPNQEP